MINDTKIPKLFFSAFSGVGWWGGGLISHRSFVLTYLPKIGIFICLFLLQYKENIVFRWVYYDLRTFEFRAKMRRCEVAKE